MGYAYEFSTGQTVLCPLPPLLSESIDSPGQPVFQVPPEVAVVVKPAFTHGSSVMRVRFGGQGHFCPVRTEKPRREGGAAP